MDSGDLQSGNRRGREITGVNIFVIARNPGKTPGARELVRDKRRDGQVG